MVPFIHTIGSNSTSVDLTRRHKVGNSVDEDGSRRKVLDRIVTNELRS